jgi:glycosyltransferase involved in cell wall biosynthesis
MNDAIDVVQIEACVQAKMLQPPRSSDEEGFCQRDKLRLLVLCMYIYPPYAGGAEIHAHYVSNALAENGYYVHVISVAPKKQVARHEKSMFNQSLVRLWPRPFNDLAYVLSVLPLAYLRRREFDVIQVHQARTAMIPAFMISKISGKPYVVTCHGSDIRILRKKTVVRLMQKILLLKASHVVAVSKEIRDLLIREYGLSSQSIMLVQNGYDEAFVKQLLARSSNSVCRRTPSLVFVGSLREVKDPINLIEAFKVVSDRIKNTHLQIVGDGHLRPAVERKVKRYKLQDRVTMHGMIPHQKALEVMASAEIYVSTSVEEGLPTSLIEAMALEKAVVTTGVGGVPEIITDGVNGLLTTPRSPERMAQLIERLLKDPVLAERLGKAAAESVRNFSWNSIAQKYQSIYREVCRRKCRGV